MQLRVCTRCKKDYPAKGADHSSKYCPDCREQILSEKQRQKRAIPSTKIVRCKGCGTEIEVKYKQNVGLFCSECRAHRDYHPCPVCGTPTKNDRKFCSSKCWGEYSSKHPIHRDYLDDPEFLARKEERKKKTYEKNHHPCPVCGSPTPNTQETCSRECMKILGNQGKHITETLLRIHQDPERHADIIRRTQESNERLFGAKTFAESDQYLDRMHQGSQEKYHRDHHMQQSYSDELLSIITDKNIAEKFIKDHNIISLSDLHQAFPDNDAPHLAHKLEKFGIILDRKFGAEEKIIKKELENIFQATFVKTRKLI